ncbi:ABC transporter ATP-binding protein [Enterobacter cloacae]|uniref:ABC transporter ATP-binding protein n=1 Tax=Enterobacter TaxID=547 RepID=UPI000651403E|nr:MULTISPECIES: ABC transporter ATP-binding protein [Enterobacter]EGS2005589.1 ABC transporter ATP-binding protein [Enterobacter cloacae]MBG0621324.1 ABC transporter ATP-binding protein [Enterobacter roggenkampii]MBG0668818.1 ABC transporter ATP-binding protein [Enterobacter roggenkampii]MEB7931194.1 ABC transporter ATP-binding protein [Enterobacter quasiroggenkampii]RAY96909.1 ABC transporter ATP-binding protein [Enterobacter cloacae]
MSSDNYAIEVKNISKCYQVYNKPVQRLKQILFGKQKEHTERVQRVNYDEFWALQDINFVLPRGETLGVVGKNGSGKSTLLQIIAGTLTPTSGSVTINGRVAALLELGAGFNNEFTGRENVYLNASLLGLSKEQVDNKLDDILAFADIGHFIDSAVRSYSSGMLVRLAFAIQAQLDPEILIVDEALAVGDAKFQAKCFNRLKKLKENGTSILFVSHATEQIVTHCDRAILLNDGLLLAQDRPKVVVNQYLDLLFGKNSKAKQAEKNVVENNSNISLSDNSPNINWEDNQGYEKRLNYNPSEYRWGDKCAEITDFILAQGKETYPVILNNNQNISFKFRIKFFQEIVRPIFGFAVKTKDGVTIYNTNTELQSIIIADITKSGQELNINVLMPQQLYQGDYFISVGIASCDANGEVIPHDRRYDSIHITVEPTEEFIGLVDLRAKISCDEK